MRRNWRAGGLGVVIALCVSTLGAGSSAQQPENHSNEAIKTYALKFGKPGSPEYAAALREAIEKAADVMDRRGGGYDKTRGVSVEDLTRRADSLSATVLSIDRDVRYQEWIEKAGDQPPITALETEEDGAIELRSVGSEKVRQSNVFAEVALAFEPPSDGYCSGVLFDRWTVLTAAHCLCRDQVRSVVFGVSLKDQRQFQINVKATKARDAVRCRSSGATQDQYWLSLRGRDIAVLRLAKPVPEDIVPSVRPLAAPSLIHSEFLKGNRSLVVVGFGRTDAGDEDHKNISIVPILSPDCSGSPGDGRSDETVYGCLKGHEILAKDRRRVGPCGGDSGGGAYLLVDNKVVNGSPKKQAVLVGLVSRSVFRPIFDCGDAGIYTLLTQDVLDWVKRAAADLASLP